MSKVIHEFTKTIVIRHLTEIRENGDLVTYTFLDTDMELRVEVLGVLELAKNEVILERNVARENKLDLSNLRKLEDIEED